MPGLVESLLLQNLHSVFGEHDAKKRRAAIATIWKVDGIFIDPDGEHVGHAAIDEAVENLLRKFPGFVFTELGPCEAFHGIGRPCMGLRSPSMPPKVTGLDVVVTKEGRLSSLYTFLDPAYVRPS